MEWRKRITLPRLGIVAAVVTLSFSQIVFQLVAENAAEFPEEARFHLGLLAWAWLLPVLVVLAADLVLVPGDEADGRLSRGWRAALYVATAASFARQFQVLYLPRRIDPIDNPVRVGAVALLLLLLWALVYRLRGRLQRYFAVLGLLAVLLAGRYVWAAGLWGPAWLPSGGISERLPQGDPRLPPVFVLLFDELSYDVLAGPDGRPDRALYPHLAALADDGLWFTQATTNAGFTNDAVRILLTGKRRTEDAEDVAPFVFDLLPPGYVAEAVSAWPPVERWIRARQAGNPRFVRRAQAPPYVPGFFELPGRLLHGLSLTAVFGGEGFQEESFEHVGAWEHRDADDRLFAESASLLRAARDAGSRGRVFFWHSSLPHFPFQLDERGLPHGEPHVSLLIPGKSTVEQVLRNYRRQVRALDLVVQRFVAALKEAGLYEEAVVVLTSDHGLRSWRTGRNISDRLARVPLLIKSPRAAPGVSDLDYQHVDFLPTLLDLLGGPVPKDAAGVSALSPERPERRKWLEWSGMILRRNGRKDEWIPSSRDETPPAGKSGSSP